MSSKLWRTSVTRAWGLRSKFEELERLAPSALSESSGRTQQELHCAMQQVDVRAVARARVRHQLRTPHHEARERVHQVAAHAGAAMSGGRTDGSAAALPRLWL
eukprot:269380-Chlamydomonas_euryale.AAC.2